MVRRGNCRPTEIMKGSPIQLLARNTVTQVRAVYFRLHVTMRCYGVHLLTVLVTRREGCSSLTQTQEQLKSSLHRPHIGAGSWLRIQDEKPIHVEAKGYFMRLLHHMPSSIRHCLTGPLLPGSPERTTSQPSASTKRRFWLATRWQSLLQVLAP